MTHTSRTNLALTAAASLVALTACGDNVAEPPALSEIDELMWETMQQEDSVTMTADFEDFTGMAQDEIEMFGDMVSGDEVGLTIYGDLGGSATALGIGDNDLMRVFEQEEAYMSADAVFTLLSSEALGMGGAEEQIFGAMAEEFEGAWVDFGSELEAEGDDFNIGALLGQLEKNWRGDDNDADTPLARDEISDQGTHEVRDDQDVWVYAGSEEGEELVLRASHDAPNIVSISDGEGTMNFRDWSETELPQRPDEAQVMDQDELELRMMQAILGGGEQ